MKFLLSAAGSFLLATSALAQQGAVVVNTGGNINCVNVKGEEGFDATSYSLGGSVATGPISGGTANPGKPALQDLNIAKNFDACSEHLIQTFLGARVIPTVTLIQYSNTSSNTLYAALTITLTNAIINTYQVSGAPSVHPTEYIAFTYSKVCVTSITPNPDGSLKSPVHVCYDVAANKLS